MVRELFLKLMGVVGVIVFEAAIIVGILYLLYKYRWKYMIRRRFK